MTGQQLQSMLHRKRRSQKWFADFCGVHETTVYRWCMLDNVSRRVARLAEIVTPDIEQENTNELAQHNS